MDNQKIRSNAISRLRNDKAAYEAEITKFQEQLKNLDKPSDIYKKNLINNQIEETKKALDMVIRRLKDFEEGDM